jgi:hypothetical protein
VNWSDGAHGGPNAEWLLRLWALAVELAAAAGVDEAGRWASLDLWPLLPLADGRLLRVRHCGMLLPEDADGGGAERRDTRQEANGDDASSDAEEEAVASSVWRQEPWLLSLLSQLGCPLLDRRFCLLPILPRAPDQPDAALLQVVGKVEAPSTPTPLPPPLGLCYPGLVAVCFLSVLMASKEPWFIAVGHIASAVDFVVKHCCCCVL